MGAREMALQTSQVVGKNCLLMGILGEDAQAGPHPTKTQLDNWIASASTPNTWVLNSQDPQPDAETIFGTNTRATWRIASIVPMRRMRRNCRRSPPPGASRQ